MSSQVPSGSSQTTTASSPATTGSNVKSQTHVPAFTPRPRRDPPGMSALFVGLTIVCALGASAVVTAAGRDGTSIEGIGTVVSEFLSNIGLRTATATADATAAEREAGETSVNLDFLNTVLRDNAKTSRQEFARVYNEITSLKSEMSALRQGTEAKVGALRANVGLLQTSLDELSLGRDSETDQINKRLAKIEDVISIRADVTASIPHQSFPPIPRKRVQRRAPWTAEEIGGGAYRVKGPTGTFEVVVGSVVPGLGRIEAVKEQRGKLHLVTGVDQPAAE
jgi:hypothetical protein